MEMLKAKDACRIKEIKEMEMEMWVVGGSVRLLVPCPGLVCGDEAIKQGRIYYGATNMMVMIMRMVMMVIWTGMWGPGHKARRQIHTEVNQTRVNMALKVSLYWPTGHP